MFFFFFLEGGEIILTCCLESPLYGFYLPGLSADPLPMHKGLQGFFGTFGGIAAQPRATSGSVDPTWHPFLEGTGGTAPTTGFFHQFQAPSRVQTANELLL